jgi:hypothetical protein
MSNPQSKKTFDTFRATHDKSVTVPNRIRAALALLKKRGDDYAYEGDLRVMAQLSPADMSSYREMFTKHVVHTLPTAGKSTAKIVWFVDPSVAAQARKTQVRR